MRGRNILYRDTAAEKVGEALLKNVRVAETVLLTGAGFSADFGGFLTEEMWSYIYDHPAMQSCPNIVHMMRGNFDYESIYQKVLREEAYEDHERKSVQRAVFDSYVALDEAMQSVRHVSTWSDDVSQMISLLAEKPGETGFLFTLNQDLLIERHYAGNAPLVLPWVPTKPRGNTRFDWNQDVVRLWKEQELQDKQDKDPLLNYEGHVMYVKLHGSLNWESHDGKKRMVIGHDEADELAGEPLLHSYHSIFRAVLRRAKRLLVIGYSFRDAHVNQIIAGEITPRENPNLGLYVVSPESPRQFIERLNGPSQGLNQYLRIPYGEFLLPKLEGYFPYRLSEILPSVRPRLWETMRHRLFR